MLSTSRAQDDVYKPNYYLSMWEFRELTLRRLQLFVAQRFFSVFDYLQGVHAAALCPTLVCLLTPYSLAEMSIPCLDTQDAAGALSCDPAPPVKPAAAPTGSFDMPACACPPQTRCGSWRAWRR